MFKALVSFNPSYKAHHCEKRNKTVPTEVLASITRSSVSCLTLQNIHMSSFHSVIIPVLHSYDRRKDRKEVKGESS